MVGAAIYAFFLVTAGFEHHDILCHLRNPQHCTSCTASQLGSDPQALAVRITSGLSYAGRAITTHVVSDGLLVVVRSTGRSPPALV
jgi:hypothetical protein